MDSRSLPVRGLPETAAGLGMCSIPEGSGPLSARNPPDGASRWVKALSNRRFTPLAAARLVCFLFLAGCADAPSATERPLNESRFLVRVPPPAELIGAGETAPPVQRVRLTGRLAGTSVVVGSAVVDVDPSLSMWTVALEVRIPPGVAPAVEVLVELISVVGGVERVEWSGKTDPIRIPPSGRGEAVEVTLVRGPVGNLGVTALKIQGAPASLRRGKSVQLSATVTTAAGVEGQPTVFWQSLDPGVGSVSEGGLFQALGKGTARVAALAGRAADTVSFPVLPALAAVAVTPDSAVVESLGATTTFLARVLDEEGGVVSGEAVTWSVSPAGVVESVAAGTFRAVAVGVATIRAVSVSEPQLSGSARMIVRQTPRRVTVAPDAVVVRGVGESASFSASALDANGNPLREGRFHWSSSDFRVAVVDSSGRTTAQGVGEARIRAEFLAPGATSGSNVWGEALFSVANLSGRVMEAETLAPLAGARVEVRSASGGRRVRSLGGRSWRCSERGPKAPVALPSGSRSRVPPPRE